MSRWLPPQPQAPSPSPASARPTLQRKSKPAARSEITSTSRVLPRWLSPGTQEPTVPAGSPSAPLGPDQIHQIAAAGVQGNGSPLPHLEELQSAFHPHDLSNVRAFIGGPAQAAADALNAMAYTVGNRIAFATPPSLQLAAHEATHVIQQRGGVHLVGGVGQTGDAYERQADDVAAGMLAEVVGPAAATSAPVAGSHPARIGTVPGMSVVQTMPSDPAYRSGSSKEEPDHIADGHAELTIGDESGANLVWLNEIKESLTGVVSSIGEWHIEYCWGQITNLPSMVDRNQEVRGLLAQSFEKGIEWDNIACMRELGPQFEMDVKRVAWIYSSLNSKFIFDERERLGLVRKRINPGTPPTKDQINAHIALTKKVAKNLLRAREYQDTLKTIWVGRITMARDLHFRIPWSYFSPGKPPRYPLYPDENPDNISYEMIQGMWDELQEEITALLNDNPLLYTLQHTEQLSTIENKSQPEALEIIKAALMQMEFNISNARDKTRDEEGFYLELWPLHRQLFSHGAGWHDTKYDWSAPFRQTVAKAIVADYQDAEFWKSLGLGMLSAALFVFAELASGGLATVAFLAGASISAQQVYESFEHYQNLSDAAKSNLHGDTALADEAQVRSARIELILNSIGCMFDLLGPAFKFGKAAYAAKMLRRTGESSKTELLVNLAKLDQLPPENARLLLEDAIAEFGVADTVSHSRKTVQQVAELLGKDSELGARLPRLLADEGLLQKLGNLDKSLTMEAKKIAALRNLREWKTLAQIQERIPEFRNINVVVKESMGDGVRVNISRTPAGIAIDSLQIGPRAVLAEIEAHRMIVSAVRRYQGFLGRLKVIEDKIGKFIGISKSKDLEIFDAIKSGTRQGELRVEIIKLEHIEKIYQQANKAADDIINYTTDRIGQINEQLNKFSDDLAALERNPLMNSEPRNYVEMPNTETLEKPLEPGQTWRYEAKSWNLRYDKNKQSISVGESSVRFGSENPSSGPISLENWNALTLGKIEKIKGTNNANKIADVKKILGQGLAVRCKGLDMKTVGKGENWMRDAIPLVSQIENKDLIKDLLDRPLRLIDETKTLRESHPYRNILKIDWIEERIKGWGKVDVHHANELRFGGDHEILVILRESDHDKIHGLILSLELTPELRLGNISKLKDPSRAKSVSITVLESGKAVLSPNR